MARTPGWCRGAGARGSTVRVFVSGPRSDRHDEPTGSEVTVWTVYPANVNSDQIGAGVKAGIRAINENGGLAGHAVVVKECKTDLTPQGEIQCYQQAADDPAAVALVSPLVIIAQDDTNAILEEAGLPAINSNPDTPATLAGLMQFPLGQALWNQPGCAVLGGDAAGADSVTFAGSETPNALEQAQEAASLAEANGMTAEILSFPITTTDVSPYVQQAIDTDADLIVVSAPPQLTGAGSLHRAAAATRAHCAPRTAWLRSRCSPVSVRTSPIST